jgi:hypothetical protein
MLVQHENENVNTFMLICKLYLDAVFELYILSFIV